MKMLNITVEQASGGEFVVRKQLDMGGELLHVFADAESFLAWIRNELGTGYMNPLKGPAGWRRREFVAQAQIDPRAEPPGGPTFPRSAEIHRPRLNEQLGAQHDQDAQRGAPAPGVDWGGLMGEVSGQDIQAPAIEIPKMPIPEF